MKDKINPNYYKDNPIQTFDAITSQFTDAEKIGAIKFNICKYIMRMGKKVETLEGARDDAGKAHWYCERLLKELTDMIKKKTPKVKPQDKDPTDLTEEDLFELDNPGYKRRKANWDIEGMLKSMPEFEVVDTVGVDYWNDWVKKNRKPAKVYNFKKGKDNSHDKDTK